MTARPHPTTIAAVQGTVRKRVWLGCALALVVVAGACTTDARVFGVATTEERRPVLSGSAGESGTPAGESPPGRSDSGGRSARSEAPIVVLTDDIGPDNAAGLTASEVAELMKPGPTGTARWLYPYDGTVFPRGIQPPLAMWQSELPPDVVYLHIYSNRFDYKGVLRPTIPEGALFKPQNGSVANATLISLQAFGRMEPQTQLAIPKLAWEAASKQSQGASDPFTIELTQRINGANGREIQGPLRATFVIARAAIKGSLYYNTCQSTLAPTDGTGRGFSGKMLRVPFGGNAELLSLDEGNQCIGCHAISADGTRAIAQRMQSTADLTATGPTAYAVSYQLTRNGLMEPGSLTPLAPGTPSMPGPVASHAALYPDGSKFLSSTALIPLAYSITSSNMPATLYDARSGAAILDTGVPAAAAMPMFSPDGRFLAFTDGGIDGARALAVMDYDVSTDRASKHRVVFQEQTQQPMRPGWPAFLPDNRALVFVRTSDPYFSGNTQGGLGAVTSAAINGTVAQSTTPSDLYITDLATRNVTLLAKAMGFHSAADAEHDELSYLPFGPDDLHRNYYPAISPVAAGGYFWMFFDSLRHFGSLGVYRLLWAAAIDVRPDGNYAVDPSHPPFVIGGQEFSTATRFRAFAALNRCEAQGAPCRTGIDCCTGICQSAGNALVEPTEAIGTCSPEDTRTCAHRDERCAETADCCDPDSGVACINNFCAQVELL